MIKDSTFELEKIWNKSWKKASVKKTMNRKKRWLPILSYFKIKPKQYWKVLDLGCGTGHDMMFFKKRYGCRVYGIDISRESIKIAKKTFGKINVIRADIRFLPFKMNSFDFVISYGTIEHVENTEKVIKEVVKVLKPNGYFIFSVPNKFSIFHFKKIIKKKLGIWDLGYEKSFSDWELKRLLSKSNFYDISFMRERHLYSSSFAIGNLLNKLDNLLMKLSKRMDFFTIVYCKKGLYDPKKC
jgi:SAM-dependent methyltransferase